MKLTLTTILLAAPLAHANTAPPDVNSGTLLANFTSDASTMDFVEGTSEVNAWRASNDPSIELTGVGATTSNIIFDPNELNGKGSIVVFRPAQLFGGARHLRRP